MRQLNLCGFSVETIAAEYETDAALKEAWLTKSPSPAWSYFNAACNAEQEERSKDYEQSRTETALQTQAG